MSHEQNYEQQGADYSETGPAGRQRLVSRAKQRNPRYGRRRGKGPQSFNGIHKRRRRKFTW